MWAIRIESRTGDSQGVGVGALAVVEREDPDAYTGIRYRGRGGERGVVGHSNGGAEVVHSDL